MTMSANDKDVPDKTEITVVTKATTRLLQLWGLSTDDQLVLLGIDPRDTLDRAKWL